MCLVYRSSLFGGATGFHHVRSRDARAGTGAWRLRDRILRLAARTVCTMATPSNPGRVAGQSNVGTRVLVSPCGVVNTPHVSGRRTTTSLVVKAAAAELPVAWPQPEQGMLAWVATTFAVLFALGAVARPSQQPISNNVNIVVIMTM